METKRARVFSRLHGIALQRSHDAWLLGFQIFELVILASSGELTVHNNK